MQKFEDKIQAPEEPTVVENAVEIQEETTHGEVIKACSAVVTANAGAILSNTVSGIEQRLTKVELVDKDTLVHEIERLKAELNRLFQQVKFATYDIEYGLADNADDVTAQLNFPGDEFNLLTTLKGITWILERADFALQRSHQGMKGLQDVIAKSKKRLNDLAQKNNAQKEKDQHAGTIKSRKEKLKPKKVKHEKLVFAINAMLKANPGDTEILATNAGKLLIFLVDNGWINPSTTMESAMKLEGPDQQFQIKKIIEEVQKQMPEVIETPTPRPDQSERNRKRRARKRLPQADIEDPMPHITEFDFVPIEGGPDFRPWLTRKTPGIRKLANAMFLILCASAGTWVGLRFLESQKTSLTYNLHSPLHEKEKIWTNSDGSKVKLQVFCTSPEHGLDDEDQVPIRVENARREVEFILKDDRPLAQEAFDLSNAKSEKHPKLFRTSNGAPVMISIKVLDFAQGIDDSEFIRTGGHNDPEGPYNVYQRTMVRTANVIVTFRGAIKERYEQSVSVTYKQKGKILQADDADDNF